MVRSRDVRLWIAVGLPSAALDRGDTLWCQGLRDSQPLQLRSFCLGGHGRSAYEQNTQQSPGFGCSTRLQPSCVHGHSAPPARVVVTAADRLTSADGSKVLEELSAVSERPMIILVGSN
jgi:hypothetical protein